MNDGWPKTLDLTAHARRSIHNLTHNPLPETGYLLYFGGKIPEHGRPYFERTLWDYGDGTGRFVEALQLVRAMADCRDDLEADDALLGLLKRFQRPDGLSYADEAPWAPPVATAWACRASILAWLLMYRRTGDAQWRQRVERMCDALLATAIREGGRTYFYHEYDGQRWLADTPMSHLNFVLLDALARAYELAGVESALRLAEEMATTIVERRIRYLEEDGSLAYGEVPQDEVEAFRERRATFAAPELAPQAAYLVGTGHVHSRTAAALGLIRMGRLLDREEWVEYGERVYRWIRAHHASSFGWVAENSLSAGSECSEMCCTMEMMEIQALLAETGRTEYWADLERFARNQAAASQFRITDRLMATIAGNLALPVPEVADDSRSYERVLERLEGGFAGPIYPHDLFCYYPRSRTDPEATRTIDISGCCSPSGAKALYLAHSRIFRVEDGVGTVYLPINRRGPEMEVRSFLPHEGRVGVRLHRDLSVRFRIPDGVKAQRICATRNGDDEPLTVEGGFARTASLPAGSQVCFRFPVVERDVTEEIGGLEYRLCYRGETLMRVEGPVGEDLASSLLPPFDRPELLAPAAEMTEEGPPQFLEEWNW